MATLSNEQSLLLFVISHQYILLNNDGEIDDDVKKALCATFNANKIDYKFPDLVKDLVILEQLRLIAKNPNEKIYDITVVAKNTPDLVVYDEKKPGQSIPAQYDNFIKIFWTLFCSFLRTPLNDLLKKIDETESKNYSELNTDADIAASVLFDLAVKRGLVVRDADGLMSLTDSGKTMLQAQK
jgi:hypothetical protein